MENPSTTTWLLIGGGVTAVAVIAYFVLKKPSTAAPQVATSSAPQLPPHTPSQSVTVRVGDIIKPPQLPALPQNPPPPAPGYYWGQPPGWDAGPPGWQPIQINQDGSILAVKPGTITLPYRVLQAGGGTGLPGYDFVITVV